MEYFDKAEINVEKSIIGLLRDSSCVQFRKALQREFLSHVYPKKYLEKHGCKEDMYNQVANYVYCESPINIRLKDKAPLEYFSQLIEELVTPEAKLSGIQTLEDIKAKCHALAIPQCVFEGTVDNYEEFLRERRSLMAQKIR